MSWFQKLFPSRICTETSGSKVPEGLWTRCDNCQAVLFRAELERANLVCPKCGHHMPLFGRKRLESFLDEPNREELAADLAPVDFLKFKDSKPYKTRLTEAQKRTGEKDALVVMKGQIFGLAVVASAFDFKFIGGSMGAVVGEKFVRGVRAALSARVPYVCFATSGGARMQEGLFSLMQMAKTSAALRELSDAGLPYIVVLLDPTFGGVSASLAMLGDVIIAEPKARIGFAGARVIEQTVRETLPEGFQQSEFLLEHGFIDIITTRHKLKATIAGLLAKLTHVPNPVPKAADT